MPPYGQRACARINSCTANFYTLNSTADTDCIAGITCVYIANGTIGITGIEDTIAIIVIISICVRTTTEEDISAIAGNARGNAYTAAIASIVGL